MPREEVAKAHPFGLDRRPTEAKSFYVRVAVARLGGVALNFTISRPGQSILLERHRQRRPRRAAGAVMMVIAMNPSIMGRLTLPAPNARGRMAGNIGHGAATFGSSRFEPCAKQTGMDHENKPSLRCHPENSPRQQPALPAAISRRGVMKENRPGLLRRRFECSILYRQHSNTGV
jgi:hypothetical protein